MASAEEGGGGRPLADRYWRSLRATQYEVQDLRFSCSTGDTHPGCWAVFPCGFPPRTTLGFAVRLRRLLPSSYPAACEHVALPDQLGLEHVDDALGLGFGFDDTRPIARAMRSRNR